MSFVIYDKRTTYIIGSDNYYDTENAALVARTEMRMRGENTDDMLIADTIVFRNSIEKVKTVRNLMTGKVIEIPTNTPRHLDPSSDVFWSVK